MMEIKKTEQRVKTPRGSFLIATNTYEEMLQLGYSIHFSHNEYKIVGNGKTAYAIV